MSERGTAAPGQRRAWIMAARPQTLPAAIAPVLVGTGVAVDHGVFAPLPALMALIGAALIQIGTNFANDYYDAVKGADSPDREGFTRVTAAGLIEPERVRQAMAVSFGLAILSGSYLVYVGGVPILVIGLASVAAGIAYTGGPYPLGYHGLGDLFVFVFFGLIAVVGTTYVQAAAVLAAPVPVTPPPGTLPWEAVIASLPVAALSTNILVVNNIRDRDEDKATGKRTLAVRFGYRFSRAEFLLLLIGAYIVPVAMVGVGMATASALLPLVTIPYAGVLLRTVLTRTAGEYLNPALERAGRLLAGFAVLFAVGVII
ncbi:MAG: 1,4-dihydroxy-2-naphthoate polyprenyltransferase [Halanaeroarchaeum sp.]